MKVPFIKKNLMCLLIVVILINCVQDALLFCTHVNVMCACLRTVLFFQSQTESSFYTTCKNHLYLKRRFFQDITYTVLWRREHSSFVQNFFAFCNGKENKTACILCEVRFLKKSQSLSITDRILLDVMCSIEALFDVETLPMQDMELQILCASKSDGI